MFYSTTDVYATKRETVHLAKGLAPAKNKVESKFITPSIYGILRSGRVIFKKIATALDEPVKIKNTIDRLSQHLGRPLSKDIQYNYTNKMVKSLGEQPVILVDDSDVIKPYGEKFESLGRVRDGSSKDEFIPHAF